jgi:hypothetical protein
MLETFYKDNMTKEAAMDLVAGAIKYGSSHFADFLTVMQIELTHGQ